MRRHHRRAKRLANQHDTCPPWAHGISRRQFLQTSAALTVLGQLAPFKPAVAKTEQEPVSPPPTPFSKQQKATLDAVQMQLFPDDGDGPSAHDLNALRYLEWALTDPDNRDDGDPEFIIKGIGWLEDLSQTTFGQRFSTLSHSQQQRLLSRTANSEAGGNWMSLLIYYLLEALLLDPLYGGNPNQIGWKWLGHQGGFPRPTAGHEFRKYVI